ncbi:MAG TPA: NAD(+)/NADH kinase [Acidimicrobiales bacterium]|nr:NAD(+)/NADH kinase [Acidimicrobiales bacterium]
MPAPSTPAPIGVIANPASGRDIRRLVANASTSTLNDKVTAVRRVLIGAAQCGAARVVALGDAPRIVRRAAEGVELGHLVEELVAPRHHDARDTTAAARAMGEVGCAVVVVHGGDGTNRAVALGWPSVPVIPISTGTNNAFPINVEPTLAGAAAGMLATGVVTLDEVGRTARVVHLEIEDEGTDLAVVDAVLLRGGLVGSMMLFEPERLGAAVVARASSSSLGMCGLAGVLHPDDPAPASIEFGAGRAVAVPVAPGAFETVGVQRAAKLGLGELVEWTGPGVLAFDGERNRKLGDGQRAWLRVEQDGPIVIDVVRAVSLGASRGAFG